MDGLETLQIIFHNIYVVLSTKDLLDFAWTFMPFILILELPFQLFIFGGIIHYFLRQKYSPPAIMPNYPPVSVIILCYSEGREVEKSILSIVEQIYPAPIQIIPVIDGATDNYETYQAVKRLAPIVREQEKREFYILPKWKRGGRVSSLNSGLCMAKYDYLLVIDADSSCDNDVLSKAIRNFSDPNIVAVSGALRIRNAKESLVARCQAMEYMLAIHSAKVALNEINAVNNISGAFGFFRTKMLKHIYGWDSGSAEDLDLTLRIKTYFGKHPNLKIAFEPEAIALTDGPATWYSFFEQRLRWDGDLFYVYVKKHKFNFNPRKLGWINFLVILWTGLMFQLIFPLIIIGYLAYLFISYSLIVAVTLLFIAWLYYFISTTILYIMHILFVSERKKYDLSFFWLLPLFPFYTFIMRIWAGIATVSEIFLHTHQDTSMAPWWVLRKSKF